jgi:hypothetical protein
MQVRLYAMGWTVRFMHARMRASSCPRSAISLRSRVAVHVDGKAMWIRKKEHKRIVENGSNLNRDVR